MFKTPTSNAAGKLIAGGQHLGATDLLGRPLFLLEQDTGAGTGDPAPATTPASADATPATPEIPADPAAEEPPTAEAWTMPEITDETPDEDIRSLFDTLKGEVEEGQKLAAEHPEQVTSALAADVTAKHAALGKLAETIQQRIEERQTNVTSITSVGDIPALPDAPISDAPATPAAKAAAVSQPAPEGGAPSPAEAAAGAMAPGSTGRTQADLDRSMQRGDRRAVMASLGETMPRWRSNDGESASFAKLVTSTRPARPGGNRTLADEGGLRKEAVMAAVSVAADVPFEQMLTDSPSANMKLINEARERHYDERAAAGTPARMAAICDPATILRDAMVIGSDATPFQSSLVQLTADSGNTLKYQYRLPTSITEAQAGIGSWGTANQDAIDRTDPETWKPCVAIACPGYDTQTATEITACYEIDAFTELSSPEAEADFVWAKDRGFARYTEGWHLRKADSWLKYVSLNGYTGAVPTVLEAVLTAISSGDYGERLDPGTYTVYGSPGLLYAMAIDENTKAYRSDMVAALNDVRQIVEDATGCTYVQLYDRELASDGTLKASPFGSFGSVGASSPTVMPRLKTAGFTLRILDPSSIVQFTTGEAQFGEQITLDQARRNHRGFFQRIFGGQMKPGITPGYKVDVAVRTDGSRGGFVLPGMPPTGFSGTVPFVATV